MKSYDHGKIEKKWQKEWNRSGIYEAKDKSSKKKFYPLVEFPFPSGSGLHTGHIRSYTAMDIVARKHRMQGENVLYPMGWDAFGLPTENYALKTGISPQIATKQNTDNFRRQLQSLGFSFDWTREINTTDPAYYKWTQWIFLQMYKKGLAYKAKIEINWCPKDKIGLANEEVIDGCCERCGTKVEKRVKDQWMLAITKYADRLYKDLDDVDYLPQIKIQQRNWIGRSEGAEIDFAIKDGKEKIKVFTTRPDTLFGVTYVVLSPEHALISKLSCLNKDEVKQYIAAAKNKTEIDRTDAKKEKTGVELKSVKAINPANGEEVSVWIADYVLVDYGTGAVMAVPAHDERDFEFAKKYTLPVKIVIEPITGTPKENEEFRRSIVAVVKDSKTNKYLSINWGKQGGNLFIGGGRDSAESVVETAKREIGEETGYTNLRFISQTETIHHHYFAHSKNVARNIEAIGLYFELIDDVKAPTHLEEDEKGKFSVEWLTSKEVEAKIVDPLHSYVYSKLVNGKIFTEAGILVDSGKFSGKDSEDVKKEITQFVGGKWVTKYKLKDWVFSRQRYWGEPMPMIHCEKCGWVPVPEKDLPVKLPEVEKYQPTDTGESPLAAMSKWVNVKCPTCKGKAVRETDTMPNWAGSSWYYLRYLDPKNKKAFADRKKIDHFMPVDWYNGGMEHTTLHLLYSRFWHKFLFDEGLVNTSEPYQKRTSHGLILNKSGEKMSKSKGEFVSPDDIVATYGADTLRLYEMFIGPFDQTAAWNTDNIIGPRRFIERLWKLQEKVAVVSNISTSKQLLHKTIKKVSDDIESVSFNTVVSSLMVLSKEFEKEEKVSRGDFEIYLKLLAPFAPHVTEEIWHELGNKKSIHLSEWPTYDENLIKDASAKIAIQVNGKVRSVIEMSADVTEEDAKKQALADANIQKWLAGKTPEKIIYVKGRVINIIVNA